MVADTQQREEREAREREEDAQKQREEARSEEITHSSEKGVAEKMCKSRQGTQKWIQMVEGRWEHLNGTQAQEVAHD